MRSAPEPAPASHLPDTDGPSPTPRTMGQLLRSTVLPINQIAADVGWPDADFAARQFRRSLGATPEAYRQFVCGAGSDDAA